MARNTIHPNGERNADFKTFYPSCFSTTEYAKCTENREFPEKPFGKVPCIPWFGDSPAEEFRMKLPIWENWEPRSLDA